MAEIGNIAARAFERKAPQTLARKQIALAADKAAQQQLKGKVLVTYLTVGNGHQKAAEAIGDAIQRKYPGVQVSLLDLAKVSTLGRWMAKAFYPLVNSGFYPKFYEMTNKVVGDGPMARISRWITQKLGGGFVDVVKQTHPDAVVSTHLLGARLIGDAMDTGAIKDHIHNFQVVTDEYGHGTYVMKHLDGTFVPSPEVARQLAKKGMDPKTLKVSGIPINPVFAEPAGDVRAKLGFGKQSRVLLVQGNLVDDVEQYKALIAQLQKAYPKGVNGQPIEVAVTTGKNAQLKADLEALAKTTGASVKLRPFGMLDAAQMRDVMKASDLTLTKPGGLTTAESVAEGLPMVLLDVMKGGQETYNAEHFVAAGAGVSTHAIDEATQRVVGLLGDSQKLTAMHAAAEKIGKPDAAAQIADVTAQALAGS